MLEQQSKSLSNKSSVKLRAYKQIPFQIEKKWKNSDKAILEFPRNEKGFITEIRRRPDLMIEECQEETTSPYGKDKSQKSTSHKKSLFSANSQRSLLSIAS